MQRWMMKLAALAGVSLAAGTLPLTATTAHASGTLLPGDPSTMHVMRTAPVVGPPVSLGLETPATGLPVPGNMPYFGGPVMTSPKVYLIFWGWGGQDPDGVRSTLVNFFNGVGGSPWEGVATQYTQTVNGVTTSISNPAGQVAGIWDDNTSPIHDNLSATDYAAEAARAVTHFGQAAPDPSANYFVATPKSFNDAGFNSNSYCAYHDFTQPSNYPGITSGIAFTVMPYVLTAGSGCGQNMVNSGAAGRLDGVTMVAGHEYMEAITDPQTGAFQGGYYDNIGNENGDKCAYVTVGPGSVTNITLSTGTFAVQGTWSNNGLSGLGSCATS